MGFRPRSTPYHFPRVQERGGGGVCGLSAPFAPPPPPSHAKASGGGFAPPASSLTCTPFDPLPPPLHETASRRWFFLVSSGIGAEPVSAPHIFLFFIISLLCTYIQTEGGITPPSGQYIYVSQMVPGMKRKDKKNIKYICSKIMNLGYLAICNAIPPFLPSPDMRKSMKYV